jgi:hypothetical protein
MSVDPANAHERIQTAGEAGVDVLVGHFCCPSKIARCQPDDPHFREQLHCYRNEQMTSMTVPVCQAAAAHAYGIYELVLLRRGQCLRNCIASPSRCSVRSSFRVTAGCRLPQRLRSSSHLK